MSKIKSVDYTRRRLRGDVTGRGFDSRRLHSTASNPQVLSSKGLAYFSFSLTADRQRNFRPISGTRYSLCLGLVER